jgi:hypothetical protein
MITVQGLRITIYNGAPQQFDIECGQPVSDAAANDIADVLATDLSGTVDSILATEPRVVTVT